MDFIFIVVRKPITKRVTHLGGIGSEKNAITQRKSFQFFVIRVLYKCLTY